MAQEYIPKAIPSVIKATSRASIKVRDSYYTVEYCEERVIPDYDEVNIDKERQALWDAVNREVDNQIDEIAEAVNAQH